MGADQTDYSPAPNNDRKRARDTEMISANDRRNDGGKSAAVDRPAHPGRSAAAPRAHGRAIHRKHSGCDHRDLRQFLARGFGLLRGLRMDIEAIGALRRERHGERDQLAVFRRDHAIATLAGMIASEERLRLDRRKRDELRDVLEVFGLLIIRHWRPRRRTRTNHEFCKAFTNLGDCFGRAKIVRAGTTTQRASA